MGPAHFIMSGKLLPSLELTWQGVVNDMGGPTIAAFDSSGVVFSVACSQTQTVMLYDSTSMDDVSSGSAPI